MPIPQLNPKNRGGQKWRRSKKKYYIPRKGRLDLRSTNHAAKKTSFRFSKRKINKKMIDFFIMAGLAGFILVAIVGLIVVAWLSRGLPDPNSLMDRQIAQSTKIFDRTGETVLYEIHGDEKRTLVNLDEMPEHLKWATITIEDKDFYKHGGFSLWAMFRTAITNVLRGQKAGGSTLTQQFVKNAILTSEKKYTRKIKEIILAYKLEKKFSKDEILQMYLNEIPYGSTAYGVEAASQRFFGKSVRKLNLPEAAILAALPQAPSRYSPYGSNKDLLLARQHYILDRMVEYGYISQEEADVAKNVELQFKESRINIIAPHFVMYVKEQLSDKYGEKMIEQGGLKIYTTLDLYKQEIAERVIAEQAEQNEEEYEATNAALVSIDPKTGQIFAMVGSRDYFNDEIDGQVNITTSLRQPGSSIKPLVYATSFVEGYTPDTVLYDVVTNFSNDPEEPYEPHNYDLEEHGPVTIRKALAGSLNIPAVKAIYLAGINNVLDLAEELGYTSFKDRDRYGLSLVLGGGEVKMLEHVNAFSAFAREGYINPISSILKIEDKDGNIIEEYKKPIERKAIDSKVARIINDILSDNDARAYAFGARNWLTLGSRPVAAKTGTTNDYRDAWTIGYTPSIVTGVWVGNNDNKEMKRGAAGGTVAAPIWHDYMKEVLGDTPIEYFKEPEKEETGKPVLDGETSGVVTIRIDSVTGLLATDDTPAELIIEEKFNQAHSILYYVDRDDPRGETPKNPSKDPQFELWEEKVIAWAEEQGFSSSTPPKEEDKVHKEENIPEFKILSPAKNQTITESFLSSRVEATAPRGIHQVEYYINDNLIYVSQNYPFSMEKAISFLPSGFHKLKVRVCDDVFNCASDSVDFNLVVDAPYEAQDLSIDILSPSSGLAMRAFDFPLEFQIAVAKPNQIAKINYYAARDGGEAILLGSSAPIESQAVAFNWNRAPESGTYKVYADVISWTGKTNQSKEVVLTIDNLIEETSGAEEDNE